MHLKWFHVTAPLNLCFRKIKAKTMDGKDPSFTRVSLLVLNGIGIFMVLVSFILNELLRKGFVRNVFRVKAITSMFAMASSHR